MKQKKNVPGLFGSDRSLKRVAVVFTVLSSFLMLYPLLFIISSSSKDNVKIYDVPPSVLPDPAQSMTIVLDYSGNALSGGAFKDILLRDNVLVMFGTVNEFPRDSILEINFYGSKDGKIVFHSRAHQMRLQLERDFGVYMGSVVTPKVLLYGDRYQRVSDALGYEFDENGLEKTPVLAGMDPRYQDTVAEYLSEKYAVQGKPVQNGVKTRNILLAESFLYYLQLPAIAISQYVIVRRLWFGIFVLNSILGIGWAMPTQIILCSIVAFVVSLMLSERAGKLVLLFFLGAMMIPFASIMLPQLIMYKSMGFYNNYPALLLPFLYPFGFYIYLYKGFFDKIPRSYFEADRLDGASTFYLNTRICMPLSKPIIFMISLQTFISNWNDFFWAWIVTENQNLWTLNVAMYNLSKNGNTKQNAIMGLAVVTTLPVILLTVLFSRQLKQSIVAAGVKG